MPIKTFISEGRAWESYKNAYRAKKNQLDQAYKVAVSSKNNEISVARQSIAQLDKDIAKNKSNIQDALADTMEYDAFNAVKHVVASFGFTCDKADRSTELTREKNNLLSNLKSKKNLEQKIGALQQQIATLDSKYKQDALMLDNDLEAKRKAIANKLIPLYSAQKARCLPKYSSGSVAPDTANEPPEKIILGTQGMDIQSLVGVLPNTMVYTPYEVDVKNEGNFIIHINQDDLYSQKLEQIMVGMILKYVDSFPSKKLRLGVFSSTLASLNLLNGLYRAMRDKSCTILPDGISSRNKLGDLFDQIEVSVQGAEDKIVNGSFNDIYDLYKAGITTEPFKVILLHNALPDISEENLLKLYSFITGYHKYGVRFIIVDDFVSVEASKGSRSQSFIKTLEKIKQSCIQATFRETAPALIDGVATSLMSTKEGFDRVSIYNYASEYLDKEMVVPYISYEDIGFGKEQRDPSEYDSITIPVASTGTDVWSMSFASVSSGKTPAPLANLILGVPGTGKTKLIDAMIYNASIKYSPDDVIFHLLDFKDGSMSEDYLMDQNKVPHVKVISANNSLEESGYILDNINEECATRENQFKTLARMLQIKVENIGIYNKLIDDNGLALPKMPRLIIAVDECQVLFETDELAKKAEKIIRMGRSRGVHFVLATQEMNTSMKKTANFIDGVYAFEAVQDDINIMFSDKAIQKRINREVPKGTYQAFASNDNGRTSTKIKISFYGPPPAPTNYAQAVRNKWSAYPCEVLQIGENSKLNINDDKYQEILSRIDGFNVAIGENYTNRKPFYLDLGANFSSMILVGGREEIASSLNTSILLSAKRSKMQTHVIDMSQTQSFARIKNECFATDSSIFVGTGKDYNQRLAQIYKLYLTRLKEKSNNPATKFEPVVFIINGAHEISDYEVDASFETASLLASTESQQAQAPVQDLTSMSFAQRKKQIQEAKVQAQSPSKEEDVQLPAKLKSKTSLIEIMGKGKKLGIFVSLWIDKSDSHTERKAFKDSCDTRIVFREFKTNVEGFLDDLFRSKMTHNVNENMALVDYYDGTRAFQKIRVYNYDLDDGNLIDFIKTL